MRASIAMECAQFRNNMKNKINRALASAALVPFVLPVVASAQIQFLSGTSLPYGGEIVSYSNGQILTTNSGNGTHAIQAYSLGSNGTLTSGISIDLATTFGGAANINSISSVLADSRGFGVASVIPNGKTSTDFGRIAIFNSSTGSILKTLDVGYHPDSVTLTPDGSKLVITNEGEFVSTAAESTFARPGSISVVDLSGVTSGNFASSIVALSSSNVATYDFSASNLAAGVSLTGIRDNTFAANNAGTTALMANIEPEYTTASNTKAFLTLQENNAIATFDFATGKFENISSLGTITQTIDASDRDGTSAGKLTSINDVVKGLPMPDTITQFSRGGSTYLVTVNEGDARGDDNDIARGATAGLIDTSNSGGGDLYYTGNISNTGIGRLQILKDMGNLDGDAGIEDPTMVGTRSFSIWNASTQARVFDSASMIEQYVADNDPTTFNMNDGLTTKYDERSDDKGPEPEALAFGTIGGRDYVFVGAERQNGIFQFDITDFGNVSITSYFNTASSTADSGGPFISPESIAFLNAANNPTGQNLLVVGYEGTGSNGSIAVFSVVPEPHSALLVGIATVFGAMRRRRA
jgi:hypothetical protein